MSLWDFEEYSTAENAADSNNAAHEENADTTETGESQFGLYSDNYKSQSNGGRGYHHRGYGRRGRGKSVDVQDRGNADYHSEDNYQDYSDGAANNTNITTTKLYQSTVFNIIPRDFKSQTIEELCQRFPATFQQANLLQRYLLRDYVIKAYKMKLESFKEDRMHATTSARSQRKQPATPSKPFGSSFATVRSQAAMPSILEEDDVEILEPAMVSSAHNTAPKDLIDILHSMVQSKHETVQDVSNFENIFIPSPPPPPQAMVSITDLITEEDVAQLNGGGAAMQTETRATAAEWARGRLVERAASSRTFERQRRTAPSINHEDQYVAHLSVERCTFRKIAPIKTIQPNRVRKWLRAAPINLSLLQNELSFLVTTLFEQQQQQQIENALNSATDSTSAATPMHEQHQQTSTLSNVRQGRFLATITSPPSAALDIYPTPVMANAPNASAIDVASDQDNISLSSSIQTIQRIPKESNIGTSTPTSDFIVKQLSIRARPSTILETNELELFPGTEIPKRELPDLTEASGERSRHMATMPTPPPPSNLIEAVAVTPAPAPAPALDDYRKEWYDVLRERRHLEYKEGAAAQRRKRRRRRRAQQQQQQTDIETNKVVVNKNDLPNIPQAEHRDDICINLNNSQSSCHGAPAAVPTADVTTDSIEQHYDNFILSNLDDVSDIVNNKALMRDILIGHGSGNFGNYESNHSRSGVGNGQRGGRGGHNKRRGDGRGRGRGDGRGRGRGRGRGGSHDGGGDGPRDYTRYGGGEDGARRWNNNRNDHKRGGERGGGDGDIFGRDFNGNGGRDSEQQKPREFYIPPEPTEDEKEIFGTGITSGINFFQYESIPIKINGNNPPEPLVSFQDADLSELVLNNIERSNYVIPTPIQKTAIPVIKNGRDLMACAQTGSGKTAAFLIPIINSLLRSNVETVTGRPHAVIISPTRELSIQIYQEARKFGNGSHLGIRIIYGGTSTKYQCELVSKNNLHILICTIGRLLDFVEKRFVSFEDTRFVVLDEADRMLEMGFKDGVATIMNHPTMRSMTTRQNLMFSATFPEEIQRMAAEYLNDYIFISIGVVGGACSDVTQVIYEVEKSKKKDKLMELLRESTDGIIVFVQTKRAADFLASFLSECDIATTSIHGDRLQSQRETALRDFKSGRMKVLIATSVAARGLDIKNVAHVINYDMPYNIDEYVHRIGRTGRVGNEGRATSFFDPKHDFGIAADLVKILEGAKQEVPYFLVNYSRVEGGGIWSGDIVENFGGLDVRDDVPQLENLFLNQPTKNTLEVCELWN